MIKFQQKLALIGAAALVAGCATTAHAAERVYLHTGSSLVCDHQQNLNGQVRLFLTPSDENYLDVAADAGTTFDGQHMFQIADDRIQKIGPETGTIL